MVAPKAHIIDIYRPRSPRQIVRILVLGAIVVAFGSCLAGVALWLSHRSRSFDNLYILAAVMVAAGPLSALWLLTKNLSKDNAIALRTDGIALLQTPYQTLIPWDFVEEASAQEEKVHLSLKPQGKLTIAELANALEAGQLARRINHLRIKAAWNKL